MLVICSDTHRIDDPGLDDQLAVDLAAADLVVHAGDFTSEAVLDALYERADRLVAVHGNADDPAVQSRLPAATTVEYAGVRLAVTHTRDGGPTELGLFGRSRGAALVVFGHSHRPTLADAGAVTLLNPGSHTQPRGNRPGYAVCTPASEGRLDVSLREPDGTHIDSTSV